MTSVPKDRGKPRELPSWLVPALVCGAIPSVLFLVGSLAVLVAWMFRGDDTGLATDPAVAAESKMEPATGLPMSSASPPMTSVPPPMMSSPMASMPSLPPPGLETGKLATAALPAPENASTPSPQKPATIADQGPRQVSYLLLLSWENNRGILRRATDYVYDPDRGRLGIVGPWEHSVGFISIDEQPKGDSAITKVKEVTVRGLPHTAFYQRMANGDGVFAIAQTEENGMILVNAETLEIVKSIRLESYPTFVWAAGRSTEQHLYFTTQLGHAPDLLIDQGVAFRLPAGWRVKMQRIDLSSMDMDPRFQGEEFETSSISKPNDRLLRTYIGIAYHDADDRYVAHKDSLYSNADGRLLTKLQFQAQIFLPGGPFITGVTNTEVVIGSINDGRVLAGFALPGEHDRLVGRIAESSLNRPIFAKIYYDPKRQLLIVGRMQHVILIPIETLGLPDEPNLLLAESPPMQVKKGDLYDFPLRTVSNEGEFTLVSGPEGMSISENALRWRPESTYTDPVEIKLKTSAGDVTREETWHVTVQ
jgi:hypothetical protein